MTREAIYRAALEDILVEADSFEGVLIADLVCSKARAALDAAAKVNEETTHSRMSASAKARRKREAAAKAPGLIKDE